MAHLVALAHELAAVIVAHEPEGGTGWRLVAHEGAVACFPGSVVLPPAGVWWPPARGRAAVERGMEL